ncbi:MAG TPA: hypothetical protein VHE78_09120 [Gemmatimonadaceae bacterium]|nr:hypothetical protein [Gemmatimonadaceae bacterium]
MLFRSHHTDTPAENRFGEFTNRFAFRKEGDLHVAEIVASPERSVELFHSLAGEMPETVDLAMHCLRTGHKFIGEGLHLAEVTEAVARLKVPLTTSAGVEIAVYTPEEQLTLSPMLDLWLFSRSDRWFYLLLGSGLEEAAELPRRSWGVKPGEFTGAPELVNAVTAAAERLTLRKI